MLPLAAGEAAGSQVEARCRVGEVMAVWGGATLPHWESKAVWCSAVRRVTPSSPNQPQNLLYILILNSNLPLSWGGRDPNDPTPGDAPQRTQPLPSRLFPSPCHHRQLQDTWQQSQVSRTHSIQEENLYLCDTRLLPSPEKSCGLPGESSLQVQEQDCQEKPNHLPSLHLN